MSLCHYVSMSLCLYVSMSLCLYVSMSPLLHVSTAPGLRISMSSCLNVSMTISPSFPEFRKRKTELTEIGNFRLFYANGKRKQQTKNKFAANGNGKRTFVFLGRQTINGKQHLLFQQKCPSMHMVNVYNTYWHLIINIDLHQNNRMVPVPYLIIFRKDI
jgi:hypothetical protein